MRFTASLSRARAAPLPACPLRVLQAPPPSHRCPSPGRCLVSHALAERAPAVAEPAVLGSPEADAEFLAPGRSPKVLVAGGGIAGLVLAVALLKKGVDVTIFERDMTAIRGEGKYRGPIQVQSNALAALEAIDVDLAREIMDEGCITGDRINGLCDGVSGDWYCKFDTFHPAVNNGLPVTRVISRVTLQQILAKKAMELGGESVIRPECKVVAFREDSVQNKPRVWAELDNGQAFWGDVLIGADGIWSRVREQLIGHTDAQYAGYTCYTGISDFVCPDIDTVAYRVFLGHGQYFVSSDVGGGKMQWYAFHEEPAGGSDPAGKQKKRLMEIFGHWNDMVTDLIAATPEEDVIRRDIYDRRPIFKWTEGRVALLGDSAHAMQPNLGQGGCMAIEDAYELAKIISQNMDNEASVSNGASSATALPFCDILQRYQNERMMRASAIHGMARMAAVAASTYKAYLGEDFHLEDRVKIPHPGKVMGRVVLGATMPLVLGWVLGGNTSKIKVSDRAQYCSITDRPHGFKEEDWPTLLSDDEALLRATQADWLLVPVHLNKAVEDGMQRATALEDIVVGSDETCDLVIDHPTISGQHATLTQRDGMYFLRAECGTKGTWLNGKRVRVEQELQLHPGDFLSFGCLGEDGCTFKVKQLHRSQRAAGLLAAGSDGQACRYRVSYKADRQKA